MQISASVGAGGRNLREDVRNVQIALNAVAPFWGGPDPLLDEDGLSGPKTIGAIRAIQSRWTKARDGRVDPGGPTIRVLNRLAGVVPPVAPAASSLSLSFGIPSRFTAPPPPAPATSPDPDVVRAQGRLKVAQTVEMPIVALAVVTALMSLIKAQQYIGALTPRNPPTGAALRSEARLAFLFVAKHFRLHESDPIGSQIAVGQVTACFARMLDAFRARTLITPEGPRFDRLFSLTRVPPHMVGRTDVAYAGQLSGSQFPNQPDGFPVPAPDNVGTLPEISDGIYLMPGFDAVPFLHVPILIHELAHLSGGLSPESIITDFHADDATLEAQTRAQHLINVNAYEYYAVELQIGTAGATELYGARGWNRRLPSCTGGSRLVAPPAPPTGPDPLAFPAGFA
jgi:hypothetical protein